MISRSSVAATVATVARRTAVLAVLLAAGPMVARAQRVDSARVAARPVTDTIRPVPKPPISPRRAFLYSLVLPGYAQSILGRHTTGAIFVLSESIALAMIRESMVDLAEARRLRTDSLLVVGFDPVNGAAITAPSPYMDGLIAVRRGHVEDWVAFLVANHLFAAADAYVGAHLWDLPTQIGLQQTPNGTALSARLSW